MVLCNCIGYYQGTAHSQIYALTYSIYSPLSHSLKKIFTQLLLWEKLYSGPQEYRDEQDTGPAQGLVTEGDGQVKRELQFRGIGEKYRILGHFGDEASNSARRTKVGFSEEVMPEYS